MNLKVIIIVLLLAVSIVSCKKSKSKSRSKHKKDGTKSKSKNNHTPAGPSTTESPDTNEDQLSTSISSTLSDVNFGALNSRPGASVVVSSTVTVLIPYSQISSSLLTTSSGIQCNGDTGATNAMWILPNGEASMLSIHNLMVQSNPLITEPNSELLRIDDAMGIGTEGVFWCHVEYGSSYTDIIPIIITNNPSVPSVDAHSCQYSGLDPVENTFGVLISANVSNGAPTIVTCTLTHDSSTSTLDGRIFRQILESEAPLEAGIQALVNIPLTSVPSSVTCSVSNNIGMDTFTCNLLQDSLVSRPVITSIERVDGSSAVIEWSSTSSASSISYTVYVMSTNRGIDDYIPFQQIQVTGTSADISGLYPGHSYDVVVTASGLSSSSSTATTQINIPSISEVTTIPMAQCNPANGQNIEIKLKKVDDSCQELVECSDSVTDSLNIELAMTALSSCGSTGDWNCTAMNPRVTKVYCRKESTPKKSKSSKNSKSKGSKSKGSKSSGSSSSNSYDIKIKAMAVCNACTNGLASSHISTPRYKDGTKGTKKNKKNKRSRILRQIIDTTSCDINVNGCDYTVSIDTKYGPQRLCGYSSASSSTDSCDCPDVCYERYSKKCTNPCASCDL